MATEVKRSRREKRTTISLYQLNPSFYNKIISRNSSASDADQVSPGGVPFTWEIQPGKPRSLPPAVPSPPPPRVPSASTPIPTNLPVVSGRKRSSFLAQRIRKFGSGISDMVVGKLRRIPNPTRLTSGQKARARAFFWRNVNRAQRKLTVAGRKIQQVKNRVSAGSPREGGSRSGISPSFSDFSAAGDGGSFSPPSRKSGSSFGKKLSAKWTNSLKLLRRGS